MVLTVVYENCLMSKSLASWKIQEKHSKVHNRNWRSEYMCSVKGSTGEISIETNDSVENLYSESQEEKEVDIQWLTGIDPK